MKCCGISDAFLAEVTVQLAENKSLVYLNLSCNRIGDDGVNSLAASLRLNRTLLSLALTNNHIGDAGALSLSNVCKTLVSYSCTWATLILYKSRYYQGLN